MNNLEILATAFEYIEMNLQDDIRTQNVADACFCSKSVVEKIFRCVSNLGVHEYITKRRMMLAAKHMIMDKEISVLDVALNYGYSTHESFSRAFKNVWNCNPSEFRTKKKYSELFPKLHAPLTDGGGYMNTRRNVDISELYELFVQRQNCYFICCDIVGLLPINEISYKLGDMAILEAHKRMLETSGEEDIVFRIGGDEFVILTNSSDVKYAENIADRIKSNDGKTVQAEGHEIPVSLHVAITRFEASNLRYRELFDKLHVAIMENKRTK